MDFAHESTQQRPRGKDAISVELAVGSGALDDHEGTGHSAKLL